MKTVLIIDDDKDTRDMLAVALSAEGWLVQSCESLLGALNILEKTCVMSCMLLDYNLPGMPLENFLENAEKLCPSIGIILVSGTENIAEKAAKYKLRYHLAKPFDFAELRTVMTACIADPSRL